MSHPLLVLIVGLAIGASAGVGSSQTATKDEAAPLPRATVTVREGVPPVAVEETPLTEENEATGDFTCDYLLDFDKGHEFVASAFLTNPADGVDAQVKVTAVWRQAGAKPITAEKTVNLPAGTTDLEVQFSKKASDNQIERIQAVDSDKQCTVTFARL